MINFNEQLSQADAKWILEDVVPKASYRIDHKTLAWWRDAHNKAFKEQVGIPGCSCEYVATMRVWQGRINQYDPQIRAIAYPVTITETGETGYTENNPKPKVGRKPKAASGLTE
jgi:hypothetical protein